MRNRKRQKWKERRRKKDIKRMRNGKREKWREREKEKERGSMPVWKQNKA